MTSSSPVHVRLGVTIGDPAGIGPEVALRALLSRQEDETPDPLTRAEAVLIGPAWAWETTARKLGIPVAFKVIDPDTREPSRLQPKPGGVPVLSVRVPPDCPDPFDIPFGEENDVCGSVALRAIEEAVRLAMAGAIDAIVTAPISKASIHAAGSAFPGHTEMLQSLSKSPRVGMLLVGGGLRVSLVTIHEPLSAVPGLLSVDRVFGMIELTNEFMKQWGRERPRLALTGLNPHVGEGGLFGDEERCILFPALERARKAGIDVDGPLPADTVYHQALEGAFDAVIALYHDQALIPIKTLDFHGGVNVTMGLPFVRTSPDHGTAFAIAGQGIARPTSMMAALSTAADLAARRKNPT